MVKRQRFSPSDFGDERSVSSKTLFVVSRFDDEGIIVAASRMTSDMGTCDANEHW